MPPLQPRTGATRDGRPLSFNRAAAPDLAPWVARVISAEVVVPEGAVISCGLFNDVANLRILFSGRWTAATETGIEHFNTDLRGQALMFGPQSKMMRISVEGSFRVAVLALRPGAEHALGAPLPPETLDRIGDLDAIVEGGRLADPFDLHASHEAWAECFEEIMRRFIGPRAPAPPDPVTSAFDRFAFLSPEAPVTDFLDQHAVTQRTLERTIKRDFGMTPKQVLRRARALDMASKLLGVVAPDEAEELALRFFDQSHLIREFSHFFGMTPQQMARRDCPLLRITLESRQARRLEELARIDPGAAHPWRAAP